MVHQQLSQAFVAKYCMLHALKCQCLVRRKKSKYGLHGSREDFSIPSDLNPCKSKLFLKLQGSRSFFEVG
jgi:hypothetical protein